MYFNVITLNYKIGLRNDDKMKRKYTTISIPEPLFEKIKERIKNTGFSSVSDYVTYILRDTLIELEKKSKNKDADTVKSRLQALGYM